MLRICRLAAVVLAALLVLPEAAGAAARRGAADDFLVARVRASVVLRDGPFGKRLERVGARTEFGSPQTFSVVRRTGGRWLGVTTSTAPNGRLVWIDTRAGKLRLSRVALRIDVDLSSRRLIVARGGRALRSFPVGIGRAGSSTPTGRFAITDKLDGGRYGTAYGCCILALSGHQPHTPLGWRGGNRLAIHGGSYGAVSAGCLHAAPRDLRALMQSIPLGTPVFIHW